MKRILGVLWMLALVACLAPSDFGVAVGGAAAIQNGSLKVVAEGRYTFGLSNVSDLPFGGDVKNGAFYATLGLEFPFGVQ
jgi:hypothetical protein